MARWTRTERVVLTVMIVVVVAASFLGAAWATSGGNGGSLSPGGFGIATVLWLQLATGRADREQRRLRLREFVVLSVLAAVTIIVGVGAMLTGGALEDKLFGGLFIVATSLVIMIVLRSYLRKLRTSASAAEEGSNDHA